MLFRSCLVSGIATVMRLGWKAFLPLNFSLGNSSITQKSVRGGGDDTQGDSPQTEVMLRMLVTQAQANFLVRKDGGVVRLQRIRNQMKATGAHCEIKLYDDKGQSTSSFSDSSIRAPDADTVQGWLDWRPSSCTRKVHIIRCSCKSGLSCWVYMKATQAALLRSQDYSVLYIERITNPIASRLWWPLLGSAKRLRRKSPASSGAQVYHHGFRAVTAPDKSNCHTPGCTRRRSGGHFLPSDYPNTCSSFDCIKIKIQSSARLYLTHWS